jgi:hypothetical protein
MKKTGFRLFLTDLPDGPIADVGMGKKAGVI